MKGFPVLRTHVTAAKEFEPRAFSVYGPKIVGMRGSYDDRALESRFLTEEMSGRALPAGIPISLPEVQEEEALALRSTLLMYRIRPDTLVLEDRRRAVSRRYGRVRRLHALLDAHAQQQDIQLARYSRSAIRKAFHWGMISRYEIAQAIAAFIPAFEARMPKRRKVWQSEDPRLWLFDAASLAMTHFAAIAGAEPP